MNKAPFQLLPELSAEEYTALRESIAADGILVPIQVDEDGVILDGHHRHAIAAELGINCPTVVVSNLDTDTDKRTVALALNLSRRHLNREQTRQVIAASITADPHLSDREHARRCGCSPTTVGTVRRKMNALSNLDTDEPTTRDNLDDVDETIDAPAHTFASEPKQVMQLRRTCDALAADNGRMHYAQHLAAAVRDNDQAWIAEQRPALEFAIAYISDLLRCHTDEDFRQRLCSGWEGRDDIAEQQVQASNVMVVHGDDLAGGIDALVDRFGDDILLRMLDRITVRFGIDELESMVKTYREMPETDDAGEILAWISATHGPQAANDIAQRVLAGGAT